jgi:hypothetical protein
LEIETNVVGVCAAPFLAARQVHHRLSSVIHFDDETGIQRSLSLPQFPDKQSARPTGTDLRTGHRCAGQQLQGGGQFESRYGVTQAAP